MTEVEQLRSIVQDCQKLLAAHQPPRGPDAQTTIAALLDILDGPRARAAKQARGSENADSNPG
jgi:hypothetical protein